MMAKASKIWITAAIALCSFGLHHVQAQGLAQQGTLVEDLVPEGWWFYAAQGDINRDGIPDLVLETVPFNEEKIKTRDDGYVYNFNQPILAIYFGNRQGLQQLWKQYDNVIPPDENENCSHEVNLEITEKGTLRIAIGLFCSAGSYGTSTNTYTYRYQNGDFFLIGFDSEELQRNSGLCTTVSENYLTWKRQVKQSNAFSNKPETEKWSRLKKKPLEPLGSREL